MRQRLEGLRGDAIHVWGGVSDAVRMFRRMSDNAGESIPEGTTADIATLT